MPTYEPGRLKPHRLVAVACIICGIAWAWASMTENNSYRAMTRWPSVTGRVTAATITDEPGGYAGGLSKLSSKHASPPRRFHLIYTYQVGDQRLQGSRIDLLPPSQHNDPSAELQRYPVNATVTVHYDPHDPTQALLDYSDPSQNTTQVWLGIAVACIGLFLFRYRPHARLPDEAEIAEIAAEQSGVSDATI